MYYPHELACVIILTTQSNEEYKIIRRILSEIVAVLEDYRAKYDPNTYQSSRLIAALLPAREILLHEVCHRKNHSLFTIVARQKLTFQQK
jgi:hypothetical protein